MKVVLVRHGRTAWNLERRIQGHRDIELSEVGRAELSARAVPERYRHLDAYASPLRRAAETARLLGLRARLDARLMEMNWGRWEGQRRADVRADGGDAVARIEAMGVDFRPPDGESPREVMARLSDWLVDAAAIDGNGVVAVTHKGVIRAALALATDWDFRGRAPAKLDWACLHAFELESPSRLRVGELNQPFDSKAGALAVATAQPPVAISGEPGEIKTS